VQGEFGRLACLCGWGPRPDMAVAAERAAWHALVCLGVLQGPYAVGAHAYHPVAVAYWVACGLDPGDPCVPGPVSFVSLPAQQVAEHAPGHLHYGRRPRRASVQSTVLRSHQIMIRNQVLVEPTGAGARFT